MSTYSSISSPQYMDGKALMYFSTRLTLLAKQGLAEREDHQQEMSDVSVDK